MVGLRRDTHFGLELGRLDLDLVSANPELRGDSPAGGLGDFVGASPTELKPRQSQYLALLEHDREPRAPARLISRRC